jgi:hypothetical protein
MITSGDDLWGRLEQLWRAYSRAHLGLMTARRDQDLQGAEMLREEAATLLQELQQLLAHEERRERVPLAALVTWLRGKTSALREQIGAERPLDWTIIRYPDRDRDPLRASTRY